MKKVLVISYYWPPAGGISVLRTLKIVKYLREFGWEPIVYAPSNAYYPYLDSNNKLEIPDGVQVIKKPIIEPFGIFKMLSGRKKDQPLNSIVQVRDRKPNLIDKFGIWIRGNFFIPDARFLWIKPSVRFLSDFVKKHPVDAIFTDGPPHTNTYIANRLKEKTNLPWLSDYQDPWTQVDYYQLLSIGKRAHRIHQKMEQECFRNADRITIASPTWRKDLESIGAKSVDVLYYGYDESDFKGFLREDSNYFDIVHIGLMGVDRNPATFLKVLSELETDQPLRLLLAGQIDIRVQQELEELKTRITVKMMGTIPRNEALHLAFNANLLLLPLNKAENARGRLPGKIYEYLRTFNPILALGPTDSDASKILEKTGTGICVEYSDKPSQKSFLEGLIHATLSIKPDKKEIEKFSNFNQTKLVAELLDEITV